MQAIELLSERIIEEAHSLQASDIHLVPREEDAAIHYRIDEDLHEKHVLKKDICQRLISHLKFLASMDIGERRKPQNGALSISSSKGRINLRLSTLPTIHDESMVIRILSKEKFPPIPKLSLFPSVTTKLLSFLNHSHGLMIFTGPTC